MYTWVHTWWGRDKAHLGYGASLEASDMRGRWHRHRQPEGEDRDRFFLRTLQQIGQSGETFMLRLEDDVVVNRFLRHNVSTWKVLQDPAFGIGFLSTCERVQGLVKCKPTADPNTMSFRAHGYHFGGGYIVRMSAIMRNLHRISEILTYIKKLNGRFGPTTAIADAIVDDGRWNMYVHVPSLVKVDVSQPSHQLGNVSKRYGEQPYSEQFRRSDAILRQGIRKHAHEGHSVSLTQNRS